ncbi:hypothetical protein V2J09_004432 [Rumex salicifolius]
MDKLGGLAAVITLVVWSLAFHQMAIGNDNDNSNNNDISCGSVTANLMTCVGFITDKDKTPSSLCCSGAKKVFDMAPTKPDRQAVCECLKTAVKSLRNIDYARIPEIPKACNIDITLPPIQNTTDCSTIRVAKVKL